MSKYPKRLIEVDLPIKRISELSRKEKSIGHISALHIWWSKKPLAACRATICATLWYDPADPLCPKYFRDKAANLMKEWAEKNIHLVSPESFQFFNSINKKPSILDNNFELRKALLNFIADFANFIRTTDKDYLNVARQITEVCVDPSGHNSNIKPLVLDPFAGSGAIPVEALRVGADAFASDLNSVPVLINKVLLQHIPKYGNELKDEFVKASKWMQISAKKELEKYYADQEGGSNAIAYLWVRVVRCEGPNCGVEVPMINSLVLEKNGKNKYGLRLDLINNKNEKRIKVVVVPISSSSHETKGTVRRGGVTCPLCQQTIPRKRIAVLAIDGKITERMVAIVCTKLNETGRFYREPNDGDLKSVEDASQKLSEYSRIIQGELSVIPDEDLPYLRSIFNVHVYGIRKWRMLFNGRQLLTITSLIKLLKIYRKKCLEDNLEKELVDAICLLLALTIDRQINALNKTCYWNPVGAKMQAGFSRQALPMFWNYCEANPFGGSVGSWESMIKCVLLTFKAMEGIKHSGIVELASATQHPLPDNSVDAIITDPPYYDTVPYADLSDFFYVWLKRMLNEQYPSLFTEELSPKKSEIVQLAERNPKYAYKTKENFEELMTLALSEARRIAKPTSVSVIIFAHQSTLGWEAMLSSIIKAGWIVTASWPIDTEMPTRVRARDSAVLASSVYLVCRPRENDDGSLINNRIGDWRDILQELPNRIHDWMPRLAEEGVVGADAIFACLGPALEIFSCYSSVEKASGEIVTLMEYLEQIWAAVAKEALTLVFKSADTLGFEADARLTAMWLWTLNSGKVSENNEETSLEEDDNEDEDNNKSDKVKTGFILEYDAARKISQGLGANLNNMNHLVEIKGDVARLIPVSERAEFLFGNEAADRATVVNLGTKRKKRNENQEDFFAKLMSEGETAIVQKNVEIIDKQMTVKVGLTVLDKVHQSMILFAAGRGEALKKFLVEDGIGQDQRFWHLAQALSALYPSSSEEKRWVDGVLARKKGLGF